MDDEDKLPSGVVGGVFSMTTADPPAVQRIGRCIRACLRPLFRLDRAPALAVGPVRPRVRGELLDEGALANGISIERDEDATG